MCAATISLPRPARIPSENQPVRLATPPAIFTCPGPGRKARWLLCARLRNLLHLFFRDNRILEKAARAAAIRVTLHQQHAFGLTNPAHCRSHVDKPWLRAILSAFLNRLLQIDIAQRRRTARCQPVVHARNDVTPAIRRVEPAAAISKSALGRSELDDMRAAPDRTSAHVLLPKRPPARTRRHFAPEFRPPCREYRPGTPNPRNCPALARSTNPSQSSPAATR